MKFYEWQVQTMQSILNTREQRARSALPATTQVWYLGL